MEENSLLLPRFARAAHALAYAAAWAVFLWGEAPPERLSPAGWFEHFLAADADTLVYLALLVLAPLAWRRQVDRENVTNVVMRGCGSFIRWIAQGRRGSFGRGCAWSLGVAALSLAASAFVGRAFDRLPPAYHDEYSYLFQAETFLAGRVAYPRHEAFRLFDQAHVLNEDKYASRYFPGTGLWMAPFVAWGNPWWGHWLAGAICAVLMFWTGRELAGDACGAMAGLLTALSPGMALFSNLLLAHHPTLVGLGFFLLGYFRCQRLQSAGWAAVAGCGLAFAAICRPMTAAGVAFPFGIDFLVWLVRGAIPDDWYQLNSRLRDTSALFLPSPLAGEGSGMGGQARSDFRFRISDFARHQAISVATPSPSNPQSTIRNPQWLLALAMSLPLVAGAAAMFAYDHAVTGSGWVTPYALYTKVYTPRHVYGFHNGTRGDQRQGPRVDKRYDDWAENLTWPLALENARTRWFASWRWTLGVIPLTIALVAGVVWWGSLPNGTRLVLAGILSLHAAHIPYWFVGMQDHHYVFEASPLWCLWTGAVTVCAARAWQAAGRWCPPLWWGAMLVFAVWTNYTAPFATWGAPLPKAIAEVRFSREKYGRFRAKLAAEVREPKVLILVEQDPAEVHINYVTNSPALDGPIIVGHYLPDVVPLTEIERLFGDRALYLYRAKDDQLTRLR